MTTTIAKPFAQTCTISLIIAIGLNVAHAQTTQPTTQPAEQVCELDEACEMGSICQDGACLAVCQDRELTTVYFDFDDSTIRVSQMEVVEANAACLRAWRDSQVRIEGHWSVTDSLDEEGQPDVSTAEFALAGGERRARAVKAALERLGIDPERLLTISYGIDRPACDAADESCWVRLRRAELVWVDGESNQD